MREIRNVRQHDGEPFRRWFTDDYWDLFVWEQAGTIVRFQLCYGKPDSEHSVTWSRQGGLSHHSVDDGESVASSHKTPILLPDGEIDFDALVTRFRSDSDDVDPTVCTVVIQTLEESAQTEP